VQIPALAIPFLRFLLFAFDLASCEVDETDDGVMSLCVDAKGLIAILLEMRDCLR
jgi:hypothetical protein